MKKGRRLILFKFAENDGDTVTYYTNGTYRYSDWERGDYSEWDVREGILWVRHAGKTEWENCKGEYKVAEIEGLKAAVAERALLK